MKKLFLLLALPMIGFGQNVNIPDANFKAALVGNIAINTNGDNEIQVSEASVFNGTINVYSLNIFSLSGIEAFVSLTVLFCQNNPLTSIDVSGCTALNSLSCQNSQLTSLDVSGCTALTDLLCAYNQLTSLDVSTCTVLTTLNCSSNLLTSLDVRNGNNNWMVYYDFNASYNPNLSCIEVDNATWSNANWPFIDATTSFSENCSALGILENNESTAILAYPNPTTGSIYLSEPANITLSDLSGKLLLEEKNTNQLDISGLPAGMYFLHFGENNNQIVKVIKE